MQNRRQNVLLLHMDPQKTAFGPFSIACGPFSIAWFRFGFVLGPFWVRFFQKFASCLHGEHNFPKRLKAVSIKKPTFLIPKWPQKEHFLALYSLLSVLWPFRSHFFRILNPSEFRKRPTTCAFLASGAPSTKTTACITPFFL